MEIIGELIQSRIISLQCIEIEVGEKNVCQKTETYKIISELVNRYSTETLLHHSRSGKWRIEILQ